MALAAILAKQLENEGTYCDSRPLRSLASKRASTRYDLHFTRGNPLDAPEPRQQHYFFERKATMKCLCCKKDVPSAARLQPENAVICTALGNMSSRVLPDDKPASERLELMFVVCDDCIIANQDDILISRGLGPYMPIAGELDHVLALAD